MSRFVLLRPKEEITIKGKKKKLDLIKKQNKKFSSLKETTTERHRFSKDWKCTDRQHTLKTIENQL